MFFDVFVFDRRQREMLQGTLHRSDCIYVRGTLQYRGVTDANGRRKHAGSIRAQSITKVMHFPRESTPPTDSTDGIEGTQ